ncbi:MAG: hypothetical protein HY922_11595 [Elusimicrobia bacterium]|nr:hypothetical protein [Elusimicrobiota bacterium]
MDKGSSRRILKGIAAITLLCLAAAAPAGCRKSPYRTFKPENRWFVCEIPSDWEILESEGYLLSTLSPDSVEVVSAELNIRRKRKRQTVETVKADMEWSRNHWSDYPEFSQEPLKTIRFSEFEALVYSYTNLNATTADMLSHVNIVDGHMPPPRPPPKPVMYKWTYVYFDTPAGPFEIEYSAPVEIYEKHRPKFQHLLDTFRWTKNGKSNG